MNKYQKLFKELQQERSLIPTNLNDHIMIVDGLNTFIRAFGATPGYNEDGQHGGGYRDWETDRKSTRLNSSHRL